MAKYLKSAKKSIEKKFEIFLKKEREEKRRYGRESYRQLLQNEEAKKLKGLS